MGGGTRQFGSHVTEVDDPDGGMLQQPAGIRHEGRCSATISLRWSTVLRGIAVTRLDQPVGD